MRGRVTSLVVGGTDKQYWEEVEGNGRVGEEYGEEEVGGGPPRRGVTLGVHSGAVTPPQ